MDIRFEDGKAYLILHRKTENDRTEVCPFCGATHKHGKYDGHRLSHCPYNKGKLKNNGIIEIGGVTLRERDGYFLVTKYIKDRRPKKGN